ncbi:MAG: hypothetical protein V4760_03155 [Bdellovibrionota bacterium]
MSAFLSTLFVSIVLQVSFSLVASAAPKSPVSDVCWGQRRVRCHHLVEGSLVQTLRGTQISRAKLDAKSEKALRADIDSFTSWATLKKARIAFERADLCGELLTVDRKGLREVYCLDLVAPKEARAKRDEFTKALENSAKR